MQKRFETQPELFVTGAVMDHPSLSGLDGAEKVLDWGKLETLMSVIYGSATGRPSYPSLTLFRSLLLGVWYRLSGETDQTHLARCRRCCGEHARRHPAGQGGGAFGRRPTVWSHGK